MEKEKQREIRNYLDTGEGSGVRDLLKNWFIRRSAAGDGRPPSGPDPVERELQALWERSLQAPPFDRARIDAAFSILEERIGHPAPASPPSLFRRPWIRRCIQAAAALTLIAGSWYASERIMIRKTYERYVTVAAPSGQRLNITLQDGTKVCLNGGTRLEYPVLFGRDRRVKLSGEALFDVGHDPEHPFVVETFACDVEVLGTKFDVTADETTRNFSTALLRGRLKVTSRTNPAEPVFMETDDLVYLDGNHLVLKTIEDPDDYLWAEGFINIRGSSFCELMKRLEKTYGTQIIVEGTAFPKLEVVRGKIPISMGLDYALRTLQCLAPFEYERDHDANVVRIRP